MDALDRPRPTKFGKKEKREYAIKKKEQEESKVFTDPKVIKQTSSLFRQHIERERKRLGLS